MAARKTTAAKALTTSAAASKTSVAVQQPATPPATVALALVKEANTSPAVKVIVPKTKKTAKVYGVKTPKPVKLKHGHPVEVETDEKPAKAPKVKKSVLKAIQTKVDTKNPIKFPTRASAKSIAATKADALRRITKPGVIALAASFGLIRVKAYAAPIVTGVTSQHRKIEIDQSTLVPATKSQVDAYREEFKRAGKALEKADKEARKVAKVIEKQQALVIKVGDAVSLTSRPKTLVGYVESVSPVLVGFQGVAGANQVVDNDRIVVVLADGSDGVTTYARSQLVKYAGKGPRFEDIPLFGAFIVKDHTHVKVSKSNAIRCVIGGSTSEPFAMLATATAKLGAAATRRFKKDDRVEVYLAGRPQARDSK